jgi:signal transduction histidine kinase
MRSAATSADSAPGGLTATGLQAALGIGFERSAAPMLLVDDDLRVIIYANPAAHLMFAADSLVGRLLSEFSTSDRTSSDAWESAALDGRMNELERESELVSDVGHQLMACVRCDPMDLFGRRFFLLQLRDITEQRRLLMASELRFAQLAASLPDAAIFMFDHDLRLLLVLGEAMRANGYDPDAMTGRLLCEAFAKDVVDLLEAPYRAALNGQPSDFDYTSPGRGRQFRMRVRPIIGPDNEVVGGLAVNEDVSGDRARQLQLEQVHRLNSLGSCWYDRRTGWSFDQELLDLWGVDRADGPVSAVADLMLAQEQAATIEQWSTTLTLGGRCSTPYRIHHGRTGQIRHLQSTYEAVVDADHNLVRAVATHVDVTAVVTASEIAESAKSAAAVARTALVRRVSESIATTHFGIDDLLLTIAELAAAALGAGVVLRILGPDQRTVERDVTAHDAEPARLNLERAAGFSATGLDPSGIAAHVIGHGRLVSTIGLRNRNPDLLRQVGEMSGESECFVVAPIRHDGKVLGLLAVSRSTPDTPFEPGDADLVQVLADRAGAAVAESRALETAARGRAERDAVVDELRRLSDDQRQLLDQFASLETRERSLLAEVIHDEPIQLIVASILRIDLLSTRSGDLASDSAELDQIATLLETSVDRLRRLIVALMPPDLVDGLGVALRDLAGGIFVGTTTLFHTSGRIHMPITVQAMEAAFRIMREALINARKHAHASNVTLRMDHADAVCVLTLTDDGVGCASMDTVPGHLGMATMRARANAEGGRLRFDSIPGQGTVVELRLPMVMAD